MRRIIYAMAFLITILSGFSQITITYPEDKVTYGPWSDSYFFYERTKSNAHHLVLEVEVDKEVAYYQISRNGEFMTYEEEREDLSGVDLFVDFPAADTKPIDLVGYLTTLNRMEVVAFDETNTEIGRDSITFYLAVKLDDYFELLETEEEFISEFSFSDDDLDKLDMTIDTVTASNELFDITKTATYLRVRNKFTNSTDEHTRIRIDIEPKEGVDEYQLHGLIPKDVVETIDEMTLEKNFTVIDEDPLMVWQFSGPQSLEFDVNSRLSTDGVDDIKVVATPFEKKEVTLKTKNPLLYYIPIALVPIIAVVFVFFHRFDKK